MKYEPLQAEKRYSIPHGTYMQLKQRQSRPECYVIHYKHSYDVLDRQLRQNQAPRLSYCLFYCFASDLTYPYGNVVGYNAKQLAGRFDVGITAIYDAMAHLYYADLARKLKKQVLLLNPHLVFAGDTEHLASARAEWDATTGFAHTKA